MNDGWKLKVFYDSLCPVCAWEMKKLRQRDAAQLLSFEDIASPDFEPSKYGLSLQQTVGAMHAVRRDGSVISGPDTFIEAYRLVGLGWLAAVLSFPLFRPFVRIGYRIFARIRPRFSKFDPAACDGGRCKI